MKVFLFSSSSTPFDSIISRVLNMFRDMAEEEIKETEATTAETTPKTELDNTTKELITEALKDAQDTQKPWYKRGLSYLIAVVLVVLLYAADKLGPDVVNKLVEIVQSLLQIM